MKIKMRQLRDLLVWLMIFGVPVLMCYAISSYGKPTKQVTYLLRK
jgi:hypothetical protein